MRLIHFSTVNKNVPSNRRYSGTAPSGGSPTIQIFCPAESNTALQIADGWFHGANQGLCSLEDMINTYYATAGHNCFMELDLAPDRTGLILTHQAARYKQLGDFY